MIAPNLDRPICEPVELMPGAPVRVEAIRHDAGAAPTDSFLHFHGAMEIVLFGRAGGYFDAADRRYALAPGAIAFVPSMVQHDFVLAAAPRDWILLQLDESIGTTLARAPDLARLRKPFCAMPGAALHAHLRHLARWLLELEPADPLAVPMAELLLRAALRAPPVCGQKLAASTHGLQRLRPAIDGLLEAPGHPPDLATAAARCALSPAYFSRRFKQRTGMSWTEYVRAHRLGLACRRLLVTDQPIARIAQDLGFSTSSHFGSVFLHRFGVTPREYRGGTRAAASAHTARKA